jgi:sugar phosphate isomerase/epimerase
MTETVHPRVSVSGLCSRQWTLEQDLAFWRQQGYRLVGIPEEKFAADPQPAVDAIKNDGVGVSSVVVANPFTLGEPHRWSEQQARVDSALEVAKQIGAQCLFINTGSSRSGMTVDDSIDALCTVLQPIITRAGELGVRFAIEPSTPVNHDRGCVHSLHDAIWVSGQTGADLIVDLQICWLERGLTAMVRANLDRVALVQVSDYIVPTETRNSRAVPGDGDIPIERILGDILAVGYSGVFDVELLGPRIVEEGYESAVPRAVTWLSNCLQRLTA